MEAFARFSQCAYMVVSKSNHEYHCAAGPLRARTDQHRDGYAIPLQRIQDISTHFALAGQVFDYGNVVVTTAGGPLKIRNLPHPKRWDQLIQQIITSQPA